MAVPTLVLMMVAAVTVGLFFDGWSHQHQQVVAASAPAALAQVVTAGSSETYTPTTRRFIITTVPLLVHGQTGTYDYLRQDFARKGLLAGKEIWGFFPNSITFYAGDRVDVTVVNPSGDDHTFTLPGVGFTST